jgi:alpha-glucosidase
MRTCSRLYGQPTGPAIGERLASVEQNDPRTLLSLYRRLIDLRRAEPALHRGQYGSIPSNDHTLAYLRSDAGKCFLIALNLANEQQAIEPTGRTTSPSYGHLVLSTHMDRADERIEGTIHLRANEGIVVEGHGAVTT